MNKIYFTKEMINFYENLKRNNNKDWFLENRHIYDNIIIPVAKEFITDMGLKLKTICNDIEYMPKVDGSIFRIHKDTRINKGKPPFKTHLGIIFWSGKIRLESPCFYLHIEPPFYYTGVGIPRTDPAFLQSYRHIINTKKYSPVLENIKTTANSNYYDINGDKLKNVPKNIIPINHTAEFFLKYKSIHISDEMPLNSDFYSESLFNNTFNIFSNLLPFFNLLKEIVKNKEN